MQNYYDGAIKVANSAFYSNHITTCGFITTSFFCYKWADMLPNKRQNGAQYCFSMFDYILFIPKFL